MIRIDFSDYLITQAPGGANRRVFGFAISSNLAAIALAALADGRGSGKTTKYNG